MHFGKACGVNVYGPDSVHEISAMFVLCPCRTQSYYALICLNTTLQSARLLLIFNKCLCYTRVDRVQHEVLLLKLDVLLLLSKLSVLLAVYLLFFFHLWFVLSFVLFMFSSIPKGYCLRRQVFTYTELLIKLLFAS